MPPRKKAETKPAQKCDAKDCPVVGVMLDFFRGVYGNDARPQVIKDLEALKDKE